MGFAVEVVCKWMAEKIAELAVVAVELVLALAPVVLPMQDCLPSSTGHYVYHPLRQTLHRSCSLRYHCRCHRWLGQFR